MVEKKLTTFAVFLLAFSILFLGVVSATDLSCPLNQNNYDHVVNIGLPELVSQYKGGYAINSSLKQVSLSPGKYEITLVARDSYPQRVSSEQPNEQYMLAFFKGGEEIAMTPPTTDLQDNVKFAEVNEVVTNNLYLPEGADSFKAVHAEYQNVPTESPNSVYAICAGIKKIQEPVCGDGKVNQQTEQCDEGSNNGVVCTAGYGSTCNYCSDTCQTETVTGPYCGDNHVDSGEQCDDGNTVSGDGCSSTCQTETQTHFCGNGELELGEECDWGILNGNLPWTPYGTSKTYCSTSCELKTITNYCGDGIKQACEQCDDGNNVSGDGCSSTCQTEDPEPTCDYDVAVRYSYGNSYDTGIAIGNGSWVSETPSNLIKGNYEIKYYVDNLKSEAVDNVTIKLMIDSLVLDEKNVSINSYTSSSYDFNASKFCGAHTLKVETGKSEGVECSLENNTAERQIYVQCNQEPPQPVCGNNIIESGEECDGGSSCNSDCTIKETNNDVETKSSNPQIVEFDYCESNWVCSGWSECSDGTTIRTCQDTNSCNDSLNKPLEEMSCSVIKPSKVEDKNNFPIFILTGTLLLIILLVLLVNYPKK